jgi:MoaA/NifB/PqqE/SkfB family radical SAM enzyme
MIWSKAYDNRELSMILEPTTHCNAACPQCPRTRKTQPVGPNDEGELYLDSWTIDQYKEYFPKETLSHIRYMNFSGTYGDPGMCKDIFEIVQYTIEQSKCLVSLNTNGSMRDADFWYEMSSLGKNRLTLEFDVDGSTQEMHNKYRQGTNLDKVLDNLMAARLGGCDVKVLTIVFKHNQNYIDEIKELIGDVRHQVIESSRFSWGPIWKFINADGKVEQLEQTDIIFKSSDTLSRRTRDHRHRHLIDDYSKIVCSKALKKSLQVNVNSMVHPCCFLIKDKHDPNEWADEEIWQEFLEADFRLSKMSLKEIVNHKWYTDSLFDSLMNQSTAMYRCKKACSIA